VGNAWLPRDVLSGMRRGWRNRAALVLLLAGLGACFPPEWGARAILMPRRRPVQQAPDVPFAAVEVVSDGVRLSGWLFRAQARPARGLVVYLHGIGDNKLSSVGIARRYAARGFDVLGYDSRAHGASSGEHCTYGYFEKLDLTRFLDAVQAKGAILFGSSLGAAVALEAAAVDPRIKGVIAQSPFADLASIVRERAPFFASRSDVAGALEIAGRTAGFDHRAVSSERAAARIRVPVLLLHGERDSETSPRHSRRIAAALAGPKRLFIVGRAGHNDVLTRAEVWQCIDRFVEGVTTGPPADPF
jgi:uncharacterized protein